MEGPSEQGHLTTFLSSYYAPGTVSPSVEKTEKWKITLQGDKFLDRGRSRGSDNRRGAQTIEARVSSSVDRLEGYLGLVPGGLVSSSSNPLHFEA